MDYLISKQLKIIYQVISKQCASATIVERFQFIELLKILNASERLIIGKLFCKLTWNIGSIRVLAVLQELRILTASEYILSLQDTDQIQLILNDFLEVEFQLVANLFIAANYDSLNAIKLNALLDECVRRLFMDLLQNPCLNELEYLKEVHTALPNELLTKVSQKHINAILELHSSNAKEAFRSFSAWVNEGVDEINFTKHLYKKLLCYVEQDVLAYLFKLSSMEHFKEWKFYLIILQTIASNCSMETTTFIRKYLKTRFRQVATLNTKHSMLHLLLTVRSSTATTIDIHKNLNAYADWYKQNISDMKFVLSVEEFQNVLSMLEQCIDYELEKNFLEIHRNIAISPPVLCGKLVHVYKNKCRIRLSQLKANNELYQPNDSIVIDDI